MNKYFPHIKIKWHTVSCFEIKIGDKTILTDPCIGLSPGTEKDADVVCGADIIPVTHIHWDHVTDIRYMIDKFGSKVIVGDLSARDLATYVDRNAHEIYPVSHNTELDFGWVKIKALMGRHHKGKLNYIDHAKMIKSKPFFSEHPKLEPLGWFGSLEYRNYIITTKENFKVLVFGNTPSIEQVNMLKDEKIDMALLQLTRPIGKELAQFAVDIGAKIVIPHHMDLAKTPHEYEPLVEEFCSAFESLKSSGIAVRTEHDKWYDIGISIK